MSPRSLFLSSTVAAALVASPAWADYAKPTITDRIEQIFATFMGDPAANVDIDMKHVLDAWRKMKPKPLDELSPEDARRQPSPIEAAASLLQMRGQQLTPYPIDTSDVTIPGPAGSLKARIYTPGGASADTPGKLRPVVVFYHGGGFVLENAAGADASARALAHGSGAIVVASSYRLAPENKFPAAARRRFWPPTNGSWKTPRASAAIRTRSRSPERVPAACWRPTRRLRRATPSFPGLPP
jgi:Esterase/lipase